MFWCMHRTNVYLTAEQERALDARARVRGTSRSAVLREILDESLATGSPSGDTIDAAFAEVASRYSEVARELFDDDEDLRTS